MEFQDLIPQIDEFIRIALKEDVKDGDHSSLACIPQGTQAKARLLVKDEGILAGLELARYIFESQAADVRFDSLLTDGTPVKYGDIAFRLEGNVHKILMLERLVLNVMQRMSGIATRTHQMVSLISDLPARLLDTRKTTPGIRFIEKWAVRIGGGHNHRFGLYDMIMLKDNHIDASGGITKAVQAVHRYLAEKSLDLKVEVETRNLDEVREALDTGGVDRIMFDNFGIPLLEEGVALVNRRCETEASGGITVDTLRSFAETGVDFISSSQMTHSVKSLDLSLKIVK